MYNILKKKNVTYFKTKVRFQLHFKRKACFRFKFCSRSNSKYLSKFTKVY